MERHADSTIMKQLVVELALLLILGIGAWLWLSAPATPPPAPLLHIEPQSTGDTVATFLHSWVPVAWYTALLVSPFALGFFGYRYMQHKHEIEMARAQREYPEKLERLSVNYGARTFAPNLSQRYPATRVPSDAPTYPLLPPALEYTLPIAAWLPEVVDHPAHLLLVGPTQSGKSTLARAILAARAQTDQIAVLDLHAKYNDWLGMPVYGAGRDFDSIVQAIWALHAEFERRFRLGEATGVPLSIFIDEFPAVSSMRKEIIAPVKQWAREAAKTGIRLVFITQEKTVKALNIEGEGDIRRNFQQLLLGAPAAVASETARTLPRPAVLQRNDEDMVAIDVTGLPSLAHRPISPDVVWMPSFSFSSSEAAPATTETTNTPIATKKKKHDLTAAKVHEIIERKQRGEKKSHACREMFGRAGGDLWYAFSAVWEQSGR
jgi:hypothetical protein